MTVSTTTPEKVCTTCQRSLPLEEFSRKTPTRLQAKCKECTRAYSKGWYEKNRESHKAKVREYKAANRDEVRRKYSEYSRNNRHKNRARRARRRAAQLRATPSWADHVAINAVYEESQETSIQTGVDHAVDHIIPLKGEKVSGLHVRENLQIITSAENLSKGNRFDPETFEGP